MDREALPPLGEFRLVLKDVLRGVRYLLRHSAGPRSLPGLEGLGTVVARLDGLPDPRHDDSPTRRIAAALDLLARLAGRRRGESYVADFRRAGYTLAKELFVLRGHANVLLGEHIFAAAARTPRFLEPPRTGAAFCAAVGLAIAGARPVELVDTAAAEDPEDLFVRSPNLAVAAAIGLATTAWIVKKGEVDALDCLSSAAEMVGPLEPRLERAVSGPRPVEALAAIFDEFAPFVP